MAPSRRRSPGIRRTLRTLPVAPAVTALVVLAIGGCSGPGGSAGGDGEGGTMAESPGTGSSGPSGIPTEVASTGFGFGQPVSSAAVAAWDIDVGPNGEGLPEGSGTVREGAEVYDANCARCHGPEGVDGPYGPVVATEGAETFPFATEPGLTTSIGNYWPYATTVYDYVRRSMPFDDPGSLSDEEVYAVTAWLLWRNELIPEDAVMDAESLPAVEMPGKEHFVPSDDVSLDALP